SDYVTRSAWGEVGRYQRRYPGKLVSRSAEIITYQGHANNHVSVQYVDHRTGPVYERAPDGALTLLRAARTPAQIFRQVHRAGGFTQINHPTIFPSSVPGFRLFCRGCPWDYDAAETGFESVDAIEIQTGPTDIGGGLNPFTQDAIACWGRARATGARGAGGGGGGGPGAG